DDRGDERTDDDVRRIEEDEREDREEDDSRRAPFPARFERCRRLARIGRGSSNDGHRWRVVSSRALNVTPTTLPGVMLIEPRVFSDERGFFLETYHAAKFREAGLPEHFLQDNHSRSKKGVLRGLHYQEPKPQGKLIRCTRGAIFDVAVDIRAGSPTFGKWFGVEPTG